MPTPIASTASATARVSDRRLGMRRARAHRGGRERGCVRLHRRRDPNASASRTASILTSTGRGITLSQSLQTRRRAGRPPRDRKGATMQVREGMSPTVLTVGPSHTLRAVTRLMSRRQVGAAVVIGPDSPGPGIITERDILASLGDGQNPDTELVADHLTRDAVFAAPDWSLEEAAW